MYHLLLVEDESWTYEELERLFIKSIDNISVKIANTIKDAHDIVNEIGNNFSVAVLDFKLPPETLGEDPIIDESICNKIREKYPGIYIIHITDHGHDEKIKEHINKYHNDPLNSLVSNIPKSGDWPTTLIKYIKMFLVSQEIAEQFVKLFTIQSGIGRSRAMFSKTHELAKFKNDVVNQWEHIDKSLQRKIASKFAVDETTSPIKLSLL